MLGGSGLLYKVLGLASCMAYMFMVLVMEGGSFFHMRPMPWVELEMMSFVERNGTQFMVDGRPFYVNGWNSFWLMDHAVEETSRTRVAEMFMVGAQMGLTVCRTWAFSDGGHHHALQVSLGHFDEEVFRALDYVIMEAQRHKIRLLLSLANNLEDYGGKSQYVKWAMEKGIIFSSSEDSFFSHPAIRYHFKIYLKDWIEEMAGYIKSIDKKHLVTVGLEGFYGMNSPPEKQRLNPSKWYATIGTDFIRNSQISAIDFASVHVYADQWLVGAKVEEKMKYVRKWVSSHVEDGERQLKKPVVVTEFGLSDRNEDFHEKHRGELYESIFDIIYRSAKNNGAGAGALVWQLMVEDKKNFSDDYTIVPAQQPNLQRLMKQQSCSLEALRYGRGGKVKGRYIE